MRNPRLVIAVVCLLGACKSTYSTSGSTTPPPRPANATYPNWEYFCSEDTRHSFDETLRQAGREGWEMVSQTDDLTCFKRPIAVPAAAPAPAPAAEPAAAPPPSEAR